MEGRERTRREGGIEGKGEIGKERQGDGGGSETRVRNKPLALVLEAKKSVIERATLFFSFVCSPASF